MRPSGASCNIDTMGKNHGLTSLRGSRLVEKDNPVIVLRGKLDTLCAMILEAQLLGERAGRRDFADDLQEILEFVRSIFAAEYSGTPVGEPPLPGPDARERCRNPQRHFGRGHLLMDRGMGELPLRLNLLRTLTREAEIAAVTAFRDPANPRPDIIEALNGLSSIFYVLTYKYLPVDYCPGGNPGVTFTGG